MALRHACGRPVGAPHAMCVALVACLALGIETVRPLKLLPADEVRLSTGRDVATRPGARSPLRRHTLLSRQIGRNSIAAVDCRLD
jgi:hypothetical protein